MNPGDVDVRELARLIGALAKMPPAKRVPAARELVEVARVVLSAAADEAVVELASSMTYAQVAEQVGTSVASVNKAVSRHRNPALRIRKK
ncbi:hypothetical protein AB0K35_27820 [Micromonospora sp. NPDC053740]|uniref:hypothetical protein n=1 Tax=Micromonospora sp. NPDC053740 TaxID=3155173 RepID=UPI003442AD6E